MQSFYRGRRVLVTGNTGFKGSWLSVILALWGAKVYGYSLKASPSEPSMYSFLDIGSYVCQAFGDIRDRIALASYFHIARPELVIHMAAQPIVSEGFRDPWTTFDTNVMGTANLLEAVRETDSVRSVVVVTSDKCYRHSGASPVSFGEDGPLGGNDPYGASKAAQEHVASAYAMLVSGRGVGLATVRSGNVVGGGDWARNRLVPDVMRALQHKEDVVLRQPLSVRPWQHVLEPLLGYLRLGQMLTQQPAMYSGPWNFGPSGQRKTVQDLVEAIRGNWKHPISVRKAESGTFHEMPSLEVDSHKAQSELGWHTVWNFETTVRTTVEWYGRWMDGGTPSQMLGMTINQITSFVQDAALERLTGMESSS